MATTPGPVCDEHWYLSETLRVFETEATNFGLRFISDAGIRAQYVAEAKRMSQEILSRVQRGEISLHAAAEEARGLRNGIMDAARTQTSELGVAMAQELKPGGLSLTALEEKYAAKLFKRGFQDLAEAERTQVWGEIVRAAGRTNETVTLRMIRLSKLGKGFMLLTVAFAVYNVATADDKVDAVAREGGGLAAGFLGGAAAGAATGLVCGPGAPVCSGVLVFVGGAMGALGFDFTYTWLKRR